jgi:hypothetical protein
MKNVLPGKKFGNWTVLSNGKKINKSYYVKCRCLCGKVKEVRVGTLINEESKSCGCIAKPARKHGKTKEKVYHVWNGMRQRCQNPNNANYARYGARGIKVCKRWNTFENFYSDMGDPPDGCSIERINNSKGYNKKNCKWASATEQANNRRTSRLVEFKGTKKTIAQWAIHFDIPQPRLSRRLCAGWPIHKALSKIKRKNQYT